MGDNKKKEKSSYALTLQTINKNFITKINVSR